MMPKTSIFVGASLVSVLLDQATKLAVAANLSFTDRIPVIDDFFYITHARNPGAAFGLFGDAPVAIRLTLFIGITLVALGMVVNFYRKLAPGDRFSALSLGMILGGAAGNLIDRVLRGEVVDFLHFRLWGGYQWPDFNLAEGEARNDPAGVERGA
jgi:signal peptidase II